MKEADDFLKHGRLEKLAKGEGKIYTKKQAPKKVQSDASFVGSVAGGFLVGGPVMGAVSAGASNPFTRTPKKGEKITGNVMIKTIMALGGYHTMYRKERDKPAWDIDNEAIKRAGQPPQSDACELIKIGIKRNIGATEYKGDDGHIILDRMIFPFVLFRGLGKADYPCTTEDQELYDEYLDKIVNSVKDIVTEENVRLDQSRK